LKPTLLFVPGLRDHVPDHWQTLMAEAMPGSFSVPPLEHDKLSCDARVEALDQAIVAIDGPVVLCAHSAGCLMVAHWAARHSRPIHAALLATPADIERPMPEPYPRLEELEAQGWLPLPRTKLPFPTLLGASRNDPLAAWDRTQMLAADWGSELLDLGAVGHLNPAAGFGEWRVGRLVVEMLLDSAAWAGTPS
jgi:predicted alpha/beta hydrolase family esterase